ALTRRWLCGLFARWTCVEELLVGRCLDMPVEAERTVPVDAVVVVAGEPPGFAGLEVVMSSAQQAAVGAGRLADRPLDTVVGVAVDGTRPATGEAAGAVACLEPSSHPRRQLVRRVTEVDRLACCRVQQQPAE